MVAITIFEVKLKKGFSLDGVVDVNKCHNQIEFTLDLRIALQAKISHKNHMLKTIFSMSIRSIHIGQINVFFLESGGAKWTANKRKTEEQEENHSAVQVCVCV